MSNIIVMAFSPRNIVGCFWGGHGHPRTPLATPLKSEVFEKRLRHGAGSSLARARDVTLKREIKRPHFAPEFNGVSIKLPSGKRF